MLWTSEPEPQVYGDSWKFTASEHCKYYEELTEELVEEQYGVTVKPGQCLRIHLEEPLVTEVAVLDPTLDTKLEQFKQLAEELGYEVEE